MIRTSHDATRPEAGGVKPRASSSDPLQVVMLSYGITEESGGPGNAAAGFAAGLAALGARVWLVATDHADGHWLVDSARAQAAGFVFRRVPGRWHATEVIALLRSIEALDIEPSRPTVLWVNGVWGAQSIAGWIAARWRRWPYIVRPAGSLGRAALRYRALKKRLYYGAIESRILKGSVAIHCMSVKEKEELPEALRAQAFIVPSGVDLPAGLTGASTGGARIVGVLARLHPIKRHFLALDAVEELNRGGLELELELVGNVDDPAYAKRLRDRAAASPWLGSRVRFLGHVSKDQIPGVVGWWRAAMLMSEQENFGHAVVTAAAVGVPTVVSDGVGLAPDLVRAGAGLIATPGGLSGALRRLIDGDPVHQSAACRAFAASFSWQRCSKELLGHLRACGVIDPGGPSSSGETRCARA